MQNESEPLFHSARAAVRFALSDERVALQQVSTYRSPGSGRGLSGFDGAGQAGIIMSHVRALGHPLSHILIANEAPPKLPCACRRDCCSGWTTNWRWGEAVEAIAAWWEGEHGGSDFQRHRLLRGCLRRFFHEHIGIDALAKRSGLHRATVSEFNGAVLKPLKPLKEAALREVEERLVEAGIVEDSTESAAAA